MFTTLPRLMLASCVLALWIGAAAAQTRKCPANAHPDGEDAKNYYCTCNKGFEPIGNACMAIPKPPLQCKTGFEPKNGACVAVVEESRQCAPLRENIALMKIAVDRARLALNVYEIYEENAAPGGKAPPGYSLVSSQTAEMRKLLPGMAEPAIKELLAPDNSTYRAAVYRDNAKGTLVLAFRGTVQFGKEFVNPNAPNAILGKPTDFFTKAQALSRDLKIYAAKNGVQLEIIGHSLGGGMAIAASAASGTRATVLNPETFKDSALLRGDLGSAKTLVTTYTTPGEPLTTLQGLSRMPAPGVHVQLPDWPGSPSMLQLGPIDAAKEWHSMRGVRQAIDVRQKQFDKAFADNKCRQ